MLDLEKLEIKLDKALQLEIMRSKIDELKEIARLSRLTIRQLRKKNKQNERAYNGKELTKYQLIFQIVYHMDSPDENED